MGPLPAQGGAFFVVFGCFVRRLLEGGLSIWGVYYITDDTTMIEICNSCKNDGKSKKIKTTIKSSLIYLIIQDADLWAREQKRSISFRKREHLLLFQK